MRQSPGPKPEQNGMRGGVEPAGGEVEAERHRRRFREQLLPIDRVLAFEDRAVRLLGAIGDLLDQRHEFRRQAGEERLQFRDRGARLVLLDERVVAMVLEAHRIGFLPLQLNDLFEPRPEGGEVVLLLGFLPRLLRFGGNAGEFLDERLRNLGGAVVARRNSRTLAAASRIGVFDEVRLFDRSQQLADLRVGELLMRQRPRGRPSARREAPPPFAGM